LANGPERAAAPCRGHVARRRASRYIGQNADPNLSLDKQLHDMIRGVHIVDAPVSH
jgi:hypothetical protein